ncbi:DUF4344 domain-containing metallopeptidase [Roseinatronobacter sp.]|uniref:DUF4344 domain-containing metallopeptidase n=1 Tax=Roseinatronobacter sp. TaxID=1945755 RepID=UPI0025D106A4|nr:DUF4344 domain-containing metallopeptidase [Roseibaca sp.]
MRKRIILTFMAMIGSTSSLSADTAEDTFVEANVLGIFYHELGHAVIDIEQVPIFGQEEDAADVFSIFLIDALFDEETATSLAYDASLGFWGEVLAREADGYDMTWWSVHGPDEQRFYNTVCLFYGADPDERETFAEDMELPEERAEYCPDEYDLAAASWGAILDDIETREAGMPIVFESGEGFAADILRHEVALLADEIRLAQPLRVSVQECGEANAFYDLETIEIIFCSEFEAHLRRIFHLIQ